MSIDIDAPEFVNLQPWFFAALGGPIWKGRVFNQQLFLLFLADSHETFGRRLIYGVHLFNLMKHGSSLSRTILKTISENDLREDFFSGDLIFRTLSQRWCADSGWKTYLGAPAGCFWILWRSLQLQHQGSKLLMRGGQHVRTASVLKVCDTVERWFHSFHSCSKVY